MEKNIDGIPGWMQLIRNHNNAFTNLINYCQSMNIQKIYLYAGCIEWEYEEYFSRGLFPYQAEFINQLQKAKNANISIDLTFYLNDAVDNMTDYQYVQSLPQIVSNLEQKSGMKLGIHMDQEPQKYTSYNDLIHMFMILKGEDHNLTIGSTIKPQWLREQIGVNISLSAFDSDVQQIIQENNQIQTFSDLIAFVLDTTAFMSYSNDKETIRNMCQNYQQHIQKLYKPGECIIETGFINNLPETETLYYTFQTDDGQNDFYTFVGQMSDLYGQLVIHDYRQFYYMMYCIWPDQKYVSGPAKCE